MRLPDSAERHPAERRLADVVTDDAPILGDAQRRELVGSTVDPGRQIIGQHRHVGVDCFALVLLA
jgi:hypothetical protein